MSSTSCQSQSMFLTCRFRSRRAADSSPLCDPERHPRPSSGDVAACSLQAFVHFPLSQVFRPMSAEFSTPSTFTMVSSRRATASCTHKTWVWRCLTRPTPRLEVIAIDAGASTRTRGFTTFCHVGSHGHCAQSSRCTLGQCVKTQLRLSLSLPHYELLPTRQGDAHRASRTKTKTTVGTSHTLPSRCLRRRPRLVVQLVCCTRPRHLGLPFRNRTRRLRACMFLIFGCCIRLASSFTANCSSHLS